MAAVYVARQGPPAVALPSARGVVGRLADRLRAPPGSSLYPKAHALVVELPNDWKAIFQVLSHPELPLTNNEAERALRHWVILVETGELGHPHRHRLGGLRPARQRYRYLLPARPVPVALSGTGHRRPARRSPSCPPCLGRGSE